MDKETIDLFIKDIEDVFVETAIFNSVADTLKNYRHITISGITGEGKTSTALMLGVKYRENGYRLILVNDIANFKLNLEHDKKLFLIFDDVLGSPRSATDLPRLKRLLHDLHLSLQNSRSFQRSATQQNAETRQIGFGKKMYVAFTANTDSLESLILKLDSEELYFLKGPTVFDMTRNGNRYTVAEKKSILQKHKDTGNFEVPEDFDKICNSVNSILGFPLICSLFSKLPGLQKDFHQFFKEPVFCVKRELKGILRRMNEQSAALILMMLCDGRLDLHQVEIKSDNERLETNLNTVGCIVKSVTRTDIARGTRHLSGTFFTESDVVSFTHPVLYDACAAVLSNINPSFALQN